MEGRCSYYYYCREPKRMSERLVVSLVGGSFGITLLLLLHKDLARRIISVKYLTKMTTTQT